MVSANREMAVYCFDTFVSHYNNEEAPPPAFEEANHEWWGASIAWMYWYTGSTPLDQWLQGLCLDKVTSHYGSVLHHKENTTNGQFAFTTQESGTNLACFEAQGKSNKDISINIDWKTGIAAKDWESFARKEKIEVNSL